MKQFNKITLKKFTVKRIEEDDEDNLDAFFSVEENEKIKLKDNEILSNGKVIKLNELQIEAVERGKDFLRQKDKYFFCVAGSAGTGKTTIAKEILKGEYGIVVTAPTHKAKCVVSEATGYIGATIHSILGLKPNTDLEDFSQNNILFALDEKTKDKIKEYKIVLIDEASMLNSTLVKMIKDKAISYGIKVIFMGDYRQLPPVKEKISQVFVDSQIEVVWLRKVERQASGNPLVDFYDKVLERIDIVDEYEELIRKQEETKRILIGKDAIEFERLKEIVYGGLPYEIKTDLSDDNKMGIIFYNSPEEFGNNISNNISNYFKLGSDLNNRILTWSNPRSGQWNKFIRKHLIGDQLSPPVVGEMIMAYRTVKSSLDWRITLFENSADYFIVDVREGYKTAANHNNSLTYDIEGYFVKIKQVKGDFDSSEKIFIVKREKSNLIKFAQIEQQYAQYADTAKLNKSFAWKQYFTFRDRFQLLEAIKNKDVGISSKPEYDLVKKDLDYAYSLTTHKSQGSTYNNVFVDANNIFSNDDLRELYRLLYVSTSRPVFITHILQTKH